MVMNLKEYKRDSRWSHMPVLNIYKSSNFYCLKDYLGWHINQSNTMKHALSISSALMYTVYVHMLQ